MYEPCTELSNYQFDLDYDSCESFADGAVYQGLVLYFIIIKIGSWFIKVF